MTNPQPPYQHPPYPPGPQRPGPPPPFGYPPAAPPKQPVPADLDTVRTLWVCSAVLGVLSVVCAVCGMDRHALAQQLYEQFNRSYPSAAKLTLSQAQTYVWVELALVGVLEVGFWLVALLVVRRMRAGRLWARTLLTAVGVFQVVKGVYSLVDVGGLRSRLELASGAMGIIQAVLAVGAIYLMYRSEANDYFQRNRQVFRR
jgi:hypothetical protein